MIYKPTDLSPSAQTFDVRDTPIFFECKVDTSNVRARGFTIKVLDSENNPVFSSIPDGEALNINYVTKITDLEEYVNEKFPKYTAGYSLLNTGYNGSYLKIPFSVAIADAATNSVKRSQIFYSETQPAGASSVSDSGLYKYNAAGTALVPVGIYNGQEYKWSITLYQLEEESGDWILPKNPLYYDMPLTTGIALGSNDIRIQSIVTDEIYQDYYVQPVLINGLKYDPNKPEAWTSSWEGSAGWDTIINANNSNRVLIKTYDPTYGFIYPVTGDSGFAADTIIPEKANGIRIYQRGNNSENLTAYQQVLYVCDAPLDNSSYGTWSWDDVDSNPSDSYALQTYNTDTDPEGVYNVPGINISLQGNERIVLNHLTYQAASRQTASGDDEYLGSPHNGIFYPQFMKQKNSSSDYDITVTWRRTPDADSWGKLITKNVTVTSPSSGSYYGKNLQIKDINENTDAYGTINETPFLFVSEKPEELFKNYYPVFDIYSYYKKGDIVRYTKPGSYTGYSGSVTYNPGDIVYDANLKYWVCIKQTQGSDPGDSNKNWALYEGQSYYIAKNNVYLLKPIAPGGSLNPNWVENPNLGTTSVIFYNNELGNTDPISSTDSTDGRLYIRHFDGLSEGMTLFKSSTTNQQQYVKIKELNSKYNFITYDKLYNFDTYRNYVSSTEVNPNPTFSTTIDTEWVPANSIGQGTKYQIKSFFRESDENAFYFYSTPTIGIHYSNAEGVDFVEGRSLTPKYYYEYKGNVENYSSTDSYRLGDVVFYNNKYYEGLKFVITKVPGSAGSDSDWRDVTSLWTDQSTTTTTYNKCFTYKKDDIVEYNNESDFTVWDSSATYSYGDKVVCLGIHCISIKNNNTNQNPLTQTAYWKNVNSDVIDTSDNIKLPTIKYIALTNVGINTPPSSKNIGIYWQQYIGALLPSQGLVESTVYSPTKIYEATVGSDNNPIVLNDGLYYYVNKSNESYSSNDKIDENTENSLGEQIWELEKTLIDYNSFTYLDEYKAWGPCTSSGEVLGTPGVYYVYSSANDSWSSYDGPDSSKDYYFVNGVAFDSNDLPYTDFDKSMIYSKGQSVFCDGLKYRVITQTSGHLLQDTDYFIRYTEHKPFTYPKKSVNSTEYNFVMGDIVLGEGEYNLSSGSKTPINPDRYYVKINGSSDSSVGADVYKPDDSSNGNWEIYYGPLYRGDAISSYDYNNTIYDENNGLYFVKLNVQNITIGLTPLQNYPPVKEAPNGVFDSGTTYSIGDIISYRDQFYICKQANQGARPSSNSAYWTLYPWQIFIPQITERTLVVNAQYDQQQYIQWKSAQWFLLDETGEDIIDQSDVFYDGDLSYTFHGLTGRNVDEDENKYFIVRLIIETHNGYRLTVDELIETVFSVEEISANGLISVQFDCDTTAVVATITKESGFIVPTQTSSSQVSYTMGDTGNNVGRMVLDGEIDYEKVAVSIENANSLVNTKDITSVAERFILQSRNSIDTVKLAGNLIGLYSSNNSSTVGAFNIYVNEMLQLNKSKYSSNPDEVLNAKEIIELNPNKDKLMWKFSDSGSQTQLTNGYVHILKEEDGSSIDLDGDISQNKLEDKSIYNYITVPVIQNGSFDSTEYNRANYLPLTYEKVNLIGDPSASFDDNTYFNTAFSYEANNSNILYSITSDVESKTMSATKTIKQIFNPLINKDSYTSDDPSGSSYDVKFNTIIFDPADSSVSYDNITTSDDDVFVIFGKTSAHWNDYKFIVPAAVLVGRKYSVSSGDVDYYTQKNVGTQYGWIWSDDASGASKWSDGDYIETHDGYNSMLGSISLNASQIDAAYFADPTIPAHPKYSKTFFNEQKKLNDVLIERAYLKDYGFALDVDLQMDADGYISPTTYGQNDDIVKVAAYVYENTDNN